MSRRRSKGQPSGHPQETPHFCSICYFQLDLEKHLPMPCTLLGTLGCDRQFVSCLPLRFILCHLLNTVSICSVPSAGDTENR